VEVVLKKMGNSTALIVPPPVLRDLGLSAGHTLSLETTADCRIVLTPKPKYTLAEMIAQCDPAAPPPADLVDWDSMKPEGGEAW